MFRFHFKPNEEERFEYQPENITKGFVICGQRHHNCFYTFSLITKDSIKERKNCIQGFLTNKNRFVDREEGYQIAKDVGQLIPREGQMEGRLDSSDLY